jgi:2-C-methyl-D-erythritol 4-phosphate cytidylyltransferase
MEKYALIMAGGIGTRMKTGVPKQFIPIHGLPVLMHSINKFRDHCQKLKIILVLPADYIDLWKQLCTEFNYKVEHQIVRGGDERYFSVKNGLNYVSEGSLVSIHDGVRPFVSEKTIETTYNTALEKGNAVAVVKPKDSIRKITDTGSRAVNRKDFVIVQTPQCFQTNIIKEAYEQEYRPEFTDDASVLESIGASINLVEGNDENIKITLPSDIRIAEAILSA